MWTLTAEGDKSLQEQLHLARPLRLRQRRCQARTGWAPNGGGHQPLARAGGAGRADGPD
jgi:hypothetical protein